MSFLPECRCPTDTRSSSAKKPGFSFLKRSNGHGELEMSMCLDCQGVFYYQKVNGVNRVTCPFCSETWQEILKGPDNA